MTKKEKSIELSSVSKSFGGLESVSNINLRAKSGEILALLGPNSFDEIRQDENDIWSNNTRPWHYYCSGNEHNGEKCRNKAEARLRSSIVGTIRSSYWS
ncbi:MAG: hypothetical protein ACOCSA_01200 [Candidatus Hadarchaeota archaeon]